MGFKSGGLFCHEPTLSIYYSRWCKSGAKQGDFDELEL